MADSVKKFLLTIAILIVIIGIYFLYFKSDSSNESFLNSGVNDRTEIVEDPKSVFENEGVFEKNNAEPTIVGWQTYHNPSKKLIFSYPPNWMIIERENDNNVLYQSYGGNAGLQNIKNSGTDKTASVSIGPAISLMGGLVWEVNIKKIVDEDESKILEISQINGTDSGEKKIEEIILIDGVKTKHVSSEIYDEGKYLKNETVTFIHDGFIYRISGVSTVLEKDYVGNTVELGYKGTPDPVEYSFKDFYQSFRLIK